MQQVSQIPPKSFQKQWLFTFKNDQNIQYLTQKVATILLGTILSSVTVKIFITSN